MNEPTNKRGWQRYRLVLVLVLFVGLLVLGKATGLIDNVDREKIRALIDDAGPWGFLVFIGVFSLGELVHIPGLAFVAAGILAYGKVLGGILSFIAGVISVTFSFVLVRTVGGQAITQSKRKWLERILAELDQRPIRTVIILRIVFIFAPALNYALALSTIRLRDYVVGSALGLLIPMALVASLFDLALHWLID
jgi:uncharacterized membrane protein YdjX (TVP38/TMEM64 family)